MISALVITATVVLVFGIVIFTGVMFDFLQDYKRAKAAGIRHLQLEAAYGHMICMIINIVLILGLACLIDYGRRG